MRQATDSGRMCMWGRGMENILVWVRIEMIRVCFNTHSGAISATNVTCVNFNCDTVITRVSHEPQNSNEYQLR